MNYADGNEARVGDSVAIDEKYRGTVVAVLDRGEFALDYPAEEWSYLANGVLIDTDFGGLVHYRDFANEEVTLLARG